MERNRRHWKVGVITISDRCSEGVREDLTGETLKRALLEDGYDVGAYVIVPDDEEAIVEKLMEFSDRKGCDLILTNGGTGVSPRDVTPEATKRVLEKELPGFSEAMRAESLKITPFAVISRALAGIRGKSLIINLPGSPSGALENFNAVKKAVPHALDKIKGDTSECGRSSFVPKST